MKERLASASAWLRLRSPVSVNLSFKRNGRATVSVERTEAAAIMKLGGNFPKVCDVLRQLGMMERAIYVERGTMARQRVLPVAEVDPASVPYFAMILVPGARWIGEAA